MPLRRLFGDEVNFFEKNQKKKLGRPKSILEVLTGPSLKSKIRTLRVFKTQASASRLVQFDAFGLGGPCKVVLKSGVHRAAVEQLAIKVEI